MSTKDGRLSRLTHCSKCVQLHAWGSISYNRSECHQMTVSTIAFGWDSSPPKFSRTPPKRQHKDRDIVIDLKHFRSWHSISYFTSSQWLQITCNNHGKLLIKPAAEENGANGKEQICPSFGRPSAKQSAFGFRGLHPGCEQTFCSLPLNSADGTARETAHRTPTPIINSRLRGCKPTTQVFNCWIRHRLHENNCPVPCKVWF